MNIREQMAARYRIGQRYQFGQVHEERHDNGNGIQHQQKLLMDAQ